jgi:hypothetical protein
VKERLITAIVVTAVVLICVFDGAVGHYILLEYPRAGNVAIGLGLVAGGVGIWARYKSEDGQDARTRRQLWCAVAFFVALLILPWREMDSSAAMGALGFFLLFSIGKIAYHDPPSGS